MLKRAADLAMKSLLLRCAIALPGLSTVATTAPDDPLPGGLRKVERHHAAPFALTNRAEDCKIALAFSESGRGAKGTDASI